MLVRKKDGREGKRKAGMKDARVDEVVGRRGKREKESKGGKGVQRVRERVIGCNGVQFRTKEAKGEVRA